MPVDIPALVRASQRTCWVAMPTPEVEDHSGREVVLRVPTDCEAMRAPAGGTAPLNGGIRSIAPPNVRDGCRSARDAVDGVTSAP